MPTIRSPRSYLLVVDSNILRVKEDLPPDSISPSFAEGWAKLTPGDNVTLVVPDVVIGELTYQRSLKMSDALRKARGELEKIAAFLGQAAPTLVDEADVIRTTKEQLLHGLRKLGKFVVEPTPFRQIAWEPIVDNAVWRRAPFERGEKEKGFRDAVILETAKVVVASNPDKTVILLTNDRQMRIAAGEQVRDTHFAVYETIEELVSVVSAARERFSPEFVQDITTRVPKLFYTPDDSTSFWYSQNLDSYIRSKCQNTFQAVPESFGAVTTQHGSLVFGRNLEVWESEWTPLNELTASVGPTKFLGLVGEREFRWETRLSYKQTFERWMTQGLLSQETTGRQTRQVEWQVTLKWHCAIADAGTISDFTVDDVSVMPTAWHSDTDYSAVRR